MSEFVEKLIEYSRSGIYPMHMPGHKRRTIRTEPDDPLSRIRAIDISEVEGFDNLNMPKGIIKELEERAGRIFGTKNCMLLVNGSTVGILAAVSACVRHGGRLLLARNSHRSAYSAAEINGLKTSYVYPEIAEEAGINGGISPAAVRRAIADDPDVQAVLITSPTYEGIISDIEGIAEVVHDYGIPLIVDEAHGAHFGFYPPFAEKYGMESAIKNGADIVVQSLHKTLPSYTQTAIMHYNSDRIDSGRLRRCVSAYQTSSPSYIFMAGIDRCLDILEDRREPLFSEYEENLEYFYDEAGALKNLRLLNPVTLVGRNSVAGFDVGKLVIMAPRGRGLYETLIRDHKIHTEMYGSNYIVAMTSIMDDRNGFDRFLKALKECDEMLDGNEESPVTGINPAINRLRPRAVMTITEALDGKEEIRMGGSRSESEGPEGCDPALVCRNFIYAYPPGIPVMAPGELFDEEIFELLDRLGESGVEMKYL